MWLKRLCAGFETCFGWDPRHPIRCWEQNTFRIQMLRHFDLYFVIDWPQVKQQGEWWPADIYPLSASSSVVVWYGGDCYEGIGENYQWVGNTVVDGDGVHIEARPRQHGYMLSMQRPPAPSPPCAIPKRFSSLAAANEFMCIPVGSHSSVNKQLRKAALVGAPFYCKSKGQTEEGFTAYRVNFPSARTQNSTKSTKRLVVELAQMLSPGPAPRKFTYGFMAPHKAASKSRIIHHHRLQLHLDLRCVFVLSDPSTFGTGSQPKHVSNPHSVIKKFKPQFYSASWFCRPRQRDRDRDRDGKPVRPRTRS